MRKLMSVVTLTLILTVNTLGSTDTPSTNESPDYLSVLIVTVVTSIAIPNLLKSRQ